MLVAKKGSVIMRKGVRKSLKTANLSICYRIGSSFASRPCWMHFGLPYMLTKVQGSYLKEGFKWNKQIHPNDLHLTLEWKGHNHSQDGWARANSELLFTAACRRWLLCHFCFVQTWVIACLSAWVFFFFYIFFYYTVNSLSAHIGHCWMTLPF